MTWTRDEIINALEVLSSHGVPPGPMARAFDVGSQAFLDVFEAEILVGLVGRGGATCRFIEGPYGAGKTHLLRMLEERAHENGMVVVSTELSRDLGIERWSVLTRYLLEKVSYRHAGRTVTSLPEVLTALAVRGADVSSLRKVSVPHASFRNAMIWAMRFALDEKPIPSELADYLCGHRVPAQKLQLYGIRDVKNPLAVRNAEQVLNTVLLTLNAAGSGGTLLLFDEAERTFQYSRPTPPRTALHAANLMRRMIDASTMERLNGFAAVFAVLPDFLQRAANLYPALGQRLQVLDAVDNVAWRMPIQRVDTVTTNSGHETFSSALVDQFLFVSAQCIVDEDRVRSQLENVRRAVLESHAGSGFRRPLVKQLADTILQFVEE